MIVQIKTGKFICNACVTLSEKRSHANTQSSIFNFFLQFSFSFKFLRAHLAAAAEEAARRNEQLAQFMASSGLPPPTASLLSMGAMAANIGASMGATGPMSAHMAHIHSLLQLRATQQHHEQQLQRQQDGQPQHQDLHNNRQENISDEGKPC